MLVAFNLKKNPHNSQPLKKKIKFHHNDHISRTHLARNRVKDWES